LKRHWGTKNDSFVSSQKWSLGTAKLRCV